MSGSVGGVDSSIPLSAGRIGQTGGNTLASDPSKFIDTLQGLNRLRMFPGQQELQQQEIQQRGNQLQLFPGQQELQQQEIQQRGNELQLFPGRQQQQQLELQRGALTNELAQQQLRDYKNKQVAAGMIPLFLKGDKATLADATNALGQLKAGGNDVDGMVEGLKTSGATSGQQLLDATRVQVSRAFPEAALPKLEYQDLGDFLQPVNTNIIAGPLGPMGAPLPKGTTPAQKTGQLPALGGTPEQPQKGEVSVGDTYDRTGQRLSTAPPAAPPVLGGRGGAPPAPAGMSPMPNTGPAGFRPTEAPLGTTEGAASSQNTYTRYQGFAESNPSSEQNIRNAAEAYRYIQGGAATPLSANASRWMVAAGMDPKALNLADPTQAQIAAKSATLALFNQMAGVQNPALAEYGMLKQANPELDLEPGALKAIMAQSIAKMNMQNDLFKEMSAYRKAHNGSMAGFDPGEFLNGVTAKMPEYQAEARKSLPLLKGETPELPPGAKQIGTKGGQPVYQLPDGTRIMVKP